MIKKGILFIMAGAVLLLSACMNDSMNAVYENEEKLASDINSFGLHEAKQSIEEEGRYIGTVSMDGMDTLWNCETEQDEDVQAVYTMKVTKGKAKLVLAAEDGTLETVTEKTSKSEEAVSETSTLHLKKGKNWMKLVTTRGTKVELDISIDKGKFEKLGLDEDFMK